MELIAKGSGRLVNKTIYIGADDEGKVNLRLEKGPEMNYGTTPAAYINYPGEYDIDGVTVFCIEADKKLSYIVKTNDETIALLQNEAVLEVATFEGIDTRVCANETIKDEIENMELEGEIVVLGEKSAA